ncbi:MAG: hypothetical protein H0U12_01770 [Thermoleophilaceae bacterium]|nr:hypothetical protein [Thermoleophilaceae bacterium]
MTPPTATTSGSELLEAVRGDFEEVERAIRAHPFPDALAEGRVPPERLHALAAEQRAIRPSWRGSPSTPRAARRRSPSWATSPHGGTTAGAWRKRCATGTARPRRPWAFFDFFATPTPGFEEAALGVVDAGLAAGEPPVAAGRAARVLQAYELMFWNALGSGL